ncbi:MAG: hypothetical protein K2I42_02315 [Anaeroplasmataceae bacterium]|nr:hypothetical protein [Anaeroplasmataceae bacterium]
MKLTKENIMNIEMQLYNKARDIDVAFYNSFMDEESKEFILDGLMMYVNQDGGFGNGLYIDDYNTNSSVYQTYEALRMLDIVGYDSKCKNPLFQTILAKAGNYLFNRQELMDGAWNPIDEKNCQFAHSVKMDYVKDFKKKWGFHPTAAILGYCFVMFEPTKAYYKKAMKQIGYAFSYFDEKEILEDYDFISFNSLLGSLKKSGQFLEEAKKIEGKLIMQASNHLNDTNFKFAAYLSNCEVKDETLKIAIEQNLDELIKKQASHGLWEHKEDWGTTQFPEADSAALKWLGAETVNTIVLLLQYGRVEL